MTQNIDTYQKTLAISQDSTPGLYCNAKEYVESIHHHVILKLKENMQYMTMFKNQQTWKYSINHFVKSHNRGSVSDHLFI